jgi:hypothetical protein
VTGTRPAPRRTEGYRAAALVAVAALVVSLVWAAVSLVPWARDIDDLPRSGIPGEVTVEVAAGEGRVVYYEREDGPVTRPLDPEIEVEVTGPDGAAVEVQPFEPEVEYHWLRRTGQAHVSFDAEVDGAHTVAATGPAPDDARFAVGESITGSLARNVAGPAVLLVTGLVVAAVMAARAASRRRA